MMETTLREYRTVLATYLGPLWRRALLLTLLLLAGIGLQLLSPQILATFIDTAVAGDSLQWLVRLGLVFLGIALLIQALSAAETYLAADVSLLATNRLRADLLRHCLHLDLSFHNEHTPGELIERVDGDVAILGNFLSRFAVDLLGSALLVVGVFVVLLTIDWRVGAALVAFTLVTLLVMDRLRNVAVPHFQQARQASAELFSLLEERLAGTEDVRANGATAYVMRRFVEHARALLRRQIRASMVSVGAYSTSSVLFTIGTVLALGAGAYLFQIGLITIGTVYLIYRYTELLTQPIQRINRQIQDLQQAGASILRIGEILRSQSRLQDTGQADLAPGAPDVIFEHVSFHYGSPEDQSEEVASPVLSDVSFSLPAGTVLGLLGHTGSGKTTLIRLLFRLYDPGEGTIRLGGVDLRDVRLAALRARVGLVTQDVQLFHASMRNNLTLFDPAISDERILQALREAGLWDWYGSLPDGLDTLLAPGGGSLSAGEAQLLALVRIFLTEPDLVILDEASSRLDPATEQWMEQATDRLLAGRTAIVIAHRLATVRRADAILILEAGRCVEFGRREDLARDPHSRFARLLQTGLEEVLA